VPNALILPLQKTMNECGAKIESMEKTYETYLHWLNIILPQKYAA
jgi:hypothetical protein